MASSKEGKKDALTGVLGHEAFMEAFAERVAQADAEGSCVSLALVDIDWFKKLNDENGREIGDEILKAVAGLLKGAVPPKGDVCRFGGDEFAVLLFGVEKEEAFLLLEEARRGFEGEHAFAAGGEERKLAVTLSAGVASYPEDGSRGQDILRKADDAVSRAKAGGRNRVCLARDEKMVTKTSHYTQGQLERLSKLAQRESMGEAVLLREALDDLLRKYDL